MSYRTEVLADSPSFVAPLSEASGNVVDIVANKVGTAYGSPTYGVAGPVAGYTAIDFPSNLDYFSFADHADLDICGAAGASAYSVEFWYARDVDPGGWAILLNKGTNGYDVGLTGSSDRMTIEKANVQEMAEATAAVAADSNWHYYVFTVAANASATGDCKLYVDGAGPVSLSYENYTTGKPIDTALSLVIGRGAAATPEPAQGKLAWVALYKSVLSSTRVAAHYAARTSGESAAITRYIAPSTASPAGNDSNDGSIGAPWLTIQKFIDQSPPAGSTLYCRGGYYYNPAVVQAGAGYGGITKPAITGTVDAPVTIRNYPGDASPPIFSGSDPNDGFIRIYDSSYLVLDGLEWEYRLVNASDKNFNAFLTLGGYTYPSYDTYNVLHTTVRNCKFRQSAHIYTRGHEIYLSGGNRYTIIEDCEFVGASFTGSSDCHNHGLHAWNGPTVDGHHPPTKDLIVRRCIFRNWTNVGGVGLLLWDESHNHLLEAAVSHCTFINNTSVDISLLEHGAVSVKDCATDSPYGLGTYYNTNYWLQDPNDADKTNLGDLTNDPDWYNFFEQEFDADYRLLPGESGVGAASDGTDAGALSGRDFYISPSGDDTTGAGTLASPWKTLRKWISTGPIAGDTLYMRGGTYASAPYSIAGYNNGDGYAHPALAGTAVLPITICNYPGEVPILSGGSGPVLGIAGASTYVVVDGMQIADRAVGSSGAWYVGGWDSTYLTHHITFRNLKFTMKAGETFNQSHGIYGEKGSQYITVEDSLFIGPGTGNLGGGGVHVYGDTGHMPSSTDWLIQRCIFKNHDARALYLWDDHNHVLRASVLHCSFVGNDDDIRADYHGAITIRDCATTKTIETWLYDPNDSSYTTADHNFGSQTFDANYLLNPSQTGWKAASDGTDAGALNNLTDIRVADSGTASLEHAAVDPTSLAAHDVAAGVEGSLLDPVQISAFDVGLLSTELTSLLQTPDAGFITASDFGGASLERAERSQVESASPGGPQRQVQYHAIVFSQDANGGPGVPICEITPELLNLRWQCAQNLPGMAVFTLVRPNRKLSLLEAMKTHVKIWREDAAGLVPIFAGKIVKVMPKATDVVVSAWDYKALLQLSRTGYMTLYPNKKIGTEIVSPEWLLAKNVDTSPLAFVTTGTIEDPLGSDGTTPITVNEDFGVVLFNRLFTFYQLAEMAMANTDNNVTFDISRTEPHTFSLSKNKGNVISGIDFTSPGNLIDYDFDKGEDGIRNDRATVISGTAGDEPYVVTDSASITEYRRLQDALSPATLVGETTGTTETDQTKAIMARLLRVGIRLPRTAILTPRQSEFRPFSDIDLGDKVRVTIINDDETGYHFNGTVRVTAFTAAWSASAGELIAVAARGLDA